MKFPQLLAQLGEAIAGEQVYSVENRNMLNHETETEYFLERSQAIALAEQLWSQIAEEDKDIYEISVHLGTLNYRTGDNKPNFTVHQKLFKAYKKIYVSQDFYKQFIQQRLNQYGHLDEEAAKKQARADFSMRYELQPKVAYGMFAGYDYAPGAENS